MADNIPITQGSGATVASDQVGGIHYQRIKVSDGTADSENHWTIDSGGRGEVALYGNVTIDSGTVTIGSALPAGTNAIGKLAANSGVDIGDVDVTSNKAWSDPNTFIGLTTAVVGSALPAGDNNIGNVDIASAIPTGSNTIGNVGIKGNVTLSDPKGFIGLVSVSGFASPLPVDATGQGDVPITLAGEKVGIAGNVTLSDAKTYVGLATVTPGRGHQFIGLTTAVQGAAGTTPWLASLRGNVTIHSGTITAVTDITNPIALKGNVTLSDAKTYIGLVTTTYSPPPISTYTSFATVYSATGNATMFQPPAGKRWVLKDLHVASLGESEVAVKSGAGYVIPFTGLSTLGGYFEHYGEAGLAADAADLGFVLELNGAATISVMANVRFE